MPRLQRDAAQDHYPQHPMACSTRHSPSRLAASPGLPCFCCLLLVGVGIALLAVPAAPAQQGESLPLRLSGITPGGLRMTATEGWGAYTFALTNFTDQDRLGRVLVFFPEDPYVEYGRDLWVPAHSTRWSWLLIGPTEKQTAEGRRDIETLLFDRTDGQDRLILPPKAMGRIRGRGVIYRPREPTTTILLDEDGPEPPKFGRLPQPDTAKEESLKFARAFRLMLRLPDHVQQVEHGPMMPLAKAFDGIDHFILASNRIADDAPGMRALRHWLQQGGKVWVMLDRIDPDVLAPLLGDALDFQLVDRIGLTKFRIQTHPAGERMAEPPLREHDRPVEFARVLLPAHEGIRDSINGWPIWFTRKVGQGDVVFTTLGFRGWVRPRLRSDPPAAFENFPSFPVPLSPLDQITLVLQPPPEKSPFDMASFQPMLTEEIGYTVIDRSTVILTFGAFLLLGLALGLALRRSRRPELLGWLGPAAALGAAGAFLFLGESSRRSAPPTLAVGQIVDAVSGKDEAAVRGVLDVYRPESGLVEAGADEGGFFELDIAGLKSQTRGKTRRLILTDMDAWHWENLTLPVGVRAASFRDTLRIREPIRAVARLGPEGLEGKITGPFQELADALVSTPSGRNLALHLGPDGSFHTGASDILPKEHFLTGAVLSDRQQKHQEIYRAFLNRSRTSLTQGGSNVVLAWAKPFDLPFHLASEARRVGDALLVVPLQLERPAPGTAVNIPGPLLSYRRIVESGSIRPVLESSENIDMHLRFQLPRAVLPFQVERARFALKIDAPSRRVTISGRDNSVLVPLHRADSPLDPLRIDITQERLLRIDPEGGLHLNLRISDMLQEDPKANSPHEVTEKWKIDYLELEISGRTK